MLPQALLGELRLIVGVHLPLLQMKHESLTACMINISDRKLNFLPGLFKNVPLSVMDLTCILLLQPSLLLLLMPLCVLPSTYTSS